MFRTDEMFEQQIKLMNENVDSFLLNGMYSAYAFLHLLNRFEFYFLHSDYYEKFIKNMFEEDQLNNIFKE